MEEGSNVIKNGLRTKPQGAQKFPHRHQVVKLFQLHSQTSLSRDTNFSPDDFNSELPGWEIRATTDSFHGHFSKGTGMVEKFRFAGHSGSTCAADHSLLGSSGLE
ncbi:hypothetical protein CDAR_466231 [Caerostris darwini]|uniref:Uncharacterized protein n=1 Tax=Caerostris darwini TaxID=1538125 RepID=A0AAV4WSP3_9ARAC|nr:hypothetical protein CDAR_466231 [Caerostris darwini]